jgi:hypothetical protein
MFWVCLICSVFNSSDRKHTDSMPFVSLTDAVSIPQPSPSYPINTHTQGWVKFWPLNMVQHNDYTGVSRVPDSSTRWSLIGYFRQYSELRSKLDKCGHGCHAGRWAAKSQWYWLDWKTLQVIMIARLHAMFQGSRTMLIFLVIIFLSVNISCVVLTAIGVKYIIPGKFTCWPAEHSSLDKHQRNWYSLACICAIMAMRGMSSFWFQWFGCSTLFGRSSRCVFRSGLL